MCQVETPSQRLALRQIRISNDPLQQARNVEKSHFNTRRCGVRETRLADSSSGRKLLNRIKGKPGTLASDVIVEVLLQAQKKLALRNFRFSSPSKRHLNGVSFRSVFDRDEERCASRQTTSP